MSEASLAGKVVALIGGGDALQRALAVAVAEAGADVALATVSREQSEEFAVNSIANEVWAIGREQFVRLMDATEATEVVSFADEVCDRLGRCDVLVATHDFPGSAPLDELSPDEWERSLAVNLTGPFLAGQAFGRLMERDGGGLVVMLVRERAQADAAQVAAAAGLERLAAHIEKAWGSAGVRAAALPAVDGAEGACARALLAQPLSRD